MFDAGSRRRADAEPIESRGVAAGNPVLGLERQEFDPRLFLAAIQHVALVFGDDQSEARDLGREIAQLDTSEIGERDFGTAPGLAAPLVDFGLDRPHLLVGDDEEVARAGGRIEHPDP